MMMLQRKVIFMDLSGGLSQEIAMTMGKRDVLVAIAFRHCAKEVVAIAEHAVKANVPVLAITDSQLSPLAKGAEVLFTVPEDEYTFSRSLAAPMCLVHTIATATAARLHSKNGDEVRIPSVTEIARGKSHALQLRLNQQEARRICEFAILLAGIISMQLGLLNAILGKFFMSTIRLTMAQALVAICATSSPLSTERKCRCFPAFLRSLAMGT